MRHDGRQQKSQAKKQGQGQQAQPRKFIATFTPSSDAPKKAMPRLLNWDDFEKEFILEGEDWEFRVKSVIANQGGKSYVLLLQPYSSPRQTDAYAKIRVIPDIATAILKSRVEVIAKWTGADFIFYEGEEAGTWERGRTAIGTPIWRWQPDDFLGNF